MNLARHLGTLIRVTLLAAPILLALPTAPAVAADMVTVTLDASSPRPLGTGLIASEGDRFLVHAQGTMSRIPFLPYTEGWYDPSGLGRQEVAGQVIPDAPYGMVIGTFTSLENGFVVGDLAGWDVQPVDQGQEFQVGLNMSEENQATIQGSFKVHVLRFTDEEATSTTVEIGPDSPRPLGTGMVAENTDQYFILASHGAGRVVPVPPVLQGWFDASGQGRLSRVGQLMENMPYGCVLGTYGSLTNSFYVGDLAAWWVQPNDVGDELLLGLNMSASDQAAMTGFFQIHVLRVDDVVVTAVDHGRDDLPASPTIASIDAYPNPFNPMTTIRCELPREQRITVSVVNLAGEHVDQLATGRHSAGTHTFGWDGRDRQGRELPSGTYLVRLQTEDGAQGRKLTLVR